MSHNITFYQRNMFPSKFLATEGHGHLPNIKKEEEIKPGSISLTKNKSVSGTSMDIILDGMMNLYTLAFPNVEEHNKVRSSKRCKQPSRDTMQRLVRRAEGPAESSGGSGPGSLC